MSEVLAAYADGGCIGPNPSPAGGTFAWMHVATDERCPAGPLPDLRLRHGCGLLLPNYGSGVHQSLTIPVIQARIAPVSNNHSEYLALLECLRHLPDGWGGTVYSDSQITLGRFFLGWKNENLPIDWIEAMLLHRRRMGNIRWRLLDGHPTRAQLAAGIGKRGNPVSVFNRDCDSVCSKLARTYLAYRQEGTSHADDERDKM